MKIEQHKYYEGIVQVKNKSTLKPDVKGLEDGRTIKVQASWVVEDGLFKGQWALTPSRLDPDFNYAWIPEEDVIIKKEISFQEYENTIL